VGTILTGLAVIALATIVSLSGMLLVRRIFRTSELDKYHSVADPTLNVVATLYSILLGFLVAGAMNTYQDTQHMVEMEANALADVYRLANGFPVEIRSKLRDMCHRYCDAIIDEEWPAMSRKETSPKVWMLSKQIWDIILVYEPQSDRQNNIHQLTLQAVQSMAENRRSRVVVMRGGFHMGLWIVVLGGSVLIIGCLYMLFVNAAGLQAMMTALVSLALFLNIFLLFVYNSPFVGDLKIAPDAFELDRTIFSVFEPPLKFGPGNGLVSAPGASSPQADTDVRK